MVNIKLFKISVVVTAFVAVTYLLKVTASFMVPVVFGILFGFLFSSVVEWLKKKRVPAGFTIPITVLIFIAVSLGVLFVIYTSVAAFAGKFYAYQTKSAEIITSIANSLPFVQDRPLVDIHDKVFSYMYRMFLDFSRNLLGFVTQLIIAVCVMLFVLIERTFLYYKFLEIFSSSKRAVQIYKAVESMNANVSKFMAIKFLISLLTGVVIYIPFIFIGVDFALLWGILTVLFNFIPNVGSVVITVVNIAFALLQFYPDWGPVIAVSVVTIAAQLIIGNAIDPLVTGDYLDVSPLVIFCALLYWGWVWGIGGMLLAVPLVVITQVICSDALDMRQVAVALSNGNKLKKHRQKSEHAAQHPRREEKSHEGAGAS